MDRRVDSFIKTLTALKLTVAFSESVTCGMASEKLSAGIGTSAILKGSIVCYSPEVKKGLLKIPEKTIKKHTCESQEVTDLLAKNISGLIEADIYAAVTGLASKGATESKEKPVGTVFLSVFYKKKMYSSKKIFRGTPMEIKEKACYALFKMILLNII